MEKGRKCQWEGWITEKLVFLVDFLNIFATVADGIVGLKSIAAYRSGLEINPNVTNEDAEEGLSVVLRGWYRM